MRFREITALVAWGCAGVAVDADDGDTDPHTDPDADTDPAIDLRCFDLKERPLPSDVDWQLTGTSLVDVTAGVREAAGWPGRSWLLHVGPGNEGCSPCTLEVQGRGAIEQVVALLVAAELELACGGDAPRPGGMGGVVTGVRLRLERIGLPELPPETLLLTTSEIGAAGCVADDHPAGQWTATWRKGAGVLEPGRYLTHRVELEDLVRRMGLNPEIEWIGGMDVLLDVYASPGWSGWIELGRAGLDACP